MDGDDGRMTPNGGGEVVMRPRAQQRRYAPGAVRAQK
jgi:hypothetical protein